MNDAQVLLDKLGNEEVKISVRALTVLMLELEQLKQKVEALESEAANLRSSN